MSSYVLPLADDSFGEKEKLAMKSVIESGNYTMGKKVEEFEERFSDWLGSKYSVMVNSGSSANLLLVYSQIISSYKKNLFTPGDEILVPALLWPTTLWPLVQFGLKPVLVDIDDKTMGLSIEDASRKITEKTKGVFLIHVLGYACEMERFQKFCKKNNLILMEDCCESFGAFYENKSVGRFGVGGTFSHFFSHHLTTMEGGSIITDDLKLVNDLRSMRAHGWTRNRSDFLEISKKYPNLDPRFLFIMPGFNVRPMEIQAAVGLVQLERINKLLNYRVQFAKFVIDELISIEWITVIGADQINLSSNPTERRHSWMNIPLIINNDSPQNVNEIKDIFENYGIETRPIITGNFMSQPAANFICEQGQFPVAQNISDQGFMIGCHAMDISEALKQAFEKLVIKLKSL
jgi:CDP-6-deoxy-D-xylo-4-hexulose-3-dehydrase